MPARPLSRRRAQAQPQSRLRRRGFARRTAAIWLGVLSLLLAATAAAVPPGVTIVNTATASYRESGVERSVSDAVAIVTDAAAGNSPPYDLLLGGTTVAGATAGAPVGAITVLDPDPDDLHSLAVDDPRFEVRDGVLALRADVSLPPGTVVSVAVTATDAAAASYTETFLIEATAVAGSAAALHTFRASTAGTARDTAAAFCATAADPDAPNAPVPPPPRPDGAPLTLPGPVTVEPAAVLAPGAGLLVEVADPDADRDSSAIETVTVVVTTEDGDVERFVLTETAPGSGVFFGLAASAAAAGASYDCAVAAPQGATARITYTDPTDATDTALGVVSFRQRSPAQIDLLVHTDDALASVTVAPTQCRVGDAWIDAAAPTTAAGDPIAVPGSVALAPSTTVALGEPVFVRVADPDADADPAEVDRIRVDVQGDGEVESLALAETGPSTGVFVGWIDAAPAPPVAHDCGLVLGADVAADFRYADATDASDVVEARIAGRGPEDAAAPFVTKTASKDVAATGEFVQYAVEVQNPSPAVFADLVLSDQLPRGFRYVDGSGRIGPATAASRAEPTIGADGRTLTFPLDALAPGARTVVRYVVEVGAGAPPGRAENRAFAASSALVSNVATATVTVREDLFASRATLVGEVTAGACDGPSHGVPGVRLLLDDGSYVVTDDDGRYHFEGLVPGTHVVQVDLPSVPAGHVLVDCAPSPRSAGRTFSRFVDLAAGTLWREDFRVVPDGSARDAFDASDGLAKVRPAVEIPELATSTGPALEPGWLGRADAAPEIVWPPAGYNPRIPAVAVVVKHAADRPVRLAVDGRAVDLLAFEGTETDRARGLTATHYRSVPLVEGDNVIEAVAVDDGQVLARRVVHLSGAPVRAEALPERSHLVADGRTPPVLAVRLYDRDGAPARPGLTGTVEVAPPYRTEGQYLVRDDGIAWIELEPTSLAGELDVRFVFDAFRAERIRARVAPATRDWVVVGFGEGTVGYGLGDGAGAPDDGFDVDGRTSLYAKGRVPGDWLTTFAYDSENRESGVLDQVIDPNRYYMLYGDGAEPGYDASSRRALYLRVERDDAFALFGDFDTGFDDTELGRYERTLNGLSAGAQTGAARFDLFAADTDQGYVKDEIRGDGTSGTYRLSRAPLLAGSEQIRIETRDRFKTEQVLESHRLTRHLDYAIDYERGTFFTKQPVPSQSAQLDPVFIVVEYEVDAGSGDAVVAGGRAVVELGAADRTVGATLLRDEAPGAGGELAAVDFEWALNARNTVRVEGGRSDADLRGRGEAWIAEVAHRSGPAAGRLYAREQEASYGLGQQATTEAGTRKVGLEGEYRLGPAFELRTDVFEQTTLDTHADRRVAEVRLERQDGGRIVATGMRAVEERAADGRHLDAHQIVSEVVVPALDGRLALHGSAETDVGSSDANTDYPNRVIVGAEWRLTERVRLLGEQELTFGERRDTFDTRIGFASTPWSGAEAATTLSRAGGENGDRLFATTGLVQTWRLDARWQLDFGMDRVQTLYDDASARDADTLSYAPSLPPASGSVGEDFAAYFVGAGYRHGDWDATARLERHDGDTTEKWNALAGVTRQLDAGRVVAGSVSFLREDALATADRRTAGEARLGLAWRPPGSAWTLLNRFDLVLEARETTGFDVRTRKLVENLGANFAPGGRHQIAFHLGAKWVLDDVDGAGYDGFTGLAGAEYRFDVRPRWDVGLRGAALRSFAADTTWWSAGVSLGHNPLENLWVTVGWNAVGFEDADFAAAEYTAQGPYLTFRFKVDQSSLGEYLSYASR